MVTLLQITLIILKALAYLSWSWWAVFAPLIILGLLIIIWFISAVVVGIRNERWFRENLKIRVELVLISLNKCLYWYIILLREATSYPSKKPQSFQTL